MENIKVNAQQPPSKNFQVLLILIQHGANGLNLLEAQHVVLVEPLLNPAAEAQAISRVHRIGQENKTLVHRFIVCALFCLCNVSCSCHQIYINVDPHTQSRSLCNSESTIDKCME